MQLSFTYFLNSFFLSPHPVLFGECGNIIVSCGIFCYSAQTLQSRCPGSVVASLHAEASVPNQRSKRCPLHCEAGSFLKDSFVCLCNFCLAGSLLLQTRNFSSCGEWRYTLVAADKASHCSDFSCCGAETLSTPASVVAAGGF